MDTKTRIIETGLALWRQDAASVSARRIGKALGMTHGAILYHHGSSAALRDALAAEAVRIGDSVIVPQLIVTRHPAARSLSDAERAAYMAAVG